MPKNKNNESDTPRKSPRQSPRRHSGETAATNPNRLFAKKESDHQGATVTTNVNITMQPPNAPPQQEDCMKGCFASLVKCFKPGP